MPFEAAKAACHQRAWATGTPRVRRMRPQASMARMFIMWVLRNSSRRAPSRTSDEQMSR